MHKNWVVVLKIFGIFTPKIGEMVQFDEHIFQKGWFNHQPEKDLTETAGRIRQDGTALVCLQVEVLTALHGWQVSMGVIFLSKLHS